jgi:hypothetical protein
MDKDELTKIIQSLDADISTSCEIILVGGAAMILHFGAMRATRDVDVLVLRGDVNDIRQAVKKVARRNDLPDDWLNDGMMERRALLTFCRLIFKNGSLC